MHVFLKLVGKHVTHCGIAETTIFAVFDVIVRRWRSWTRSETRLRSPTRHIVDKTLAGSVHVMDAVLKTRTIHAWRRRLQCSTLQISFVPLPSEGSRGGGGDADRIGMQAKKYSIRLLAPVIPALWSWFCSFRFWWFQWWAWCWYSWWCYRWVPGCCYVRGEEAAYKTVKASIIIVIASGSSTIRRTNSTGTVPSNGSGYCSTSSVDIDPLFWCCCLMFGTAGGWWSLLSLRWRRDNEVFATKKSLPSSGFCSESWRRTTAALACLPARYSVRIGSGSKNSEKISTHARTSASSSADSGNGCHCCYCSCCCCCGFRFVWRSHASCADMTITTDAGCGALCKCGDGAFRQYRYLQPTMLALVAATSLSSG